MSQSKKTNLYEGLFLFNPAVINSNLNTALNTLNQFLERAEAEVIAVHKWDDRKLAYEIGSQKRGLYLIAYFRAAGNKLTGLERDTNLSEAITRAMVIRADHLGDIELNEAVAKAELTRQEAALQGEAPTQTENDSSDQNAETAATGAAE